MHLRLRHVRCLVAVAAEGNLGRAARELQLTQPAVSKTLAELEQTLGQRLVERGRFGARLTAAGERFLPRAEKLVEALEAAARTFSDDSEAQPATLRIGALPTVAPDLLPAALLAVTRRAPAITLAVRTVSNPELIAQLRGGQLELAIGRMAEPAAMAGISFELLYDDPLVACVRTAHPLAKRRRLEWSALAPYPLVLPEAGTLPHHSALHQFLDRGVALPEGRIETLSVGVALKLLAASDALWVTPLGAARLALERGEIVRLALPQDAAHESIGVMLRVDTPRSAHATRVVEALRELAGARRPAHRTSLVKRVPARTTDRPAGRVRP